MKGSQVYPQTIARVTGVLFIITFITAIPAQLVLYVPVLDDPRYIVGAGADARVFWGALLEVILVVANIGTAVVLYPIVKRQNEGVALGYVTARVLESAVIMVGPKEYAIVLGNGATHKGVAENGRLCLLFLRWRCASSSRTTCPLWPPRPS
jgi:hypothetical protein